MIKNLPKEISINDLQNFNFGDIEANNDDLLVDSICRTSSIIEFLKGKKNVVLGEKGTGKTAIYRLLKEEKLRFKPKNGFENLIIPIADNFQYKNIKDKVLKLVNTDSEEESFKYQVVWELFIFFKIVKKIQSKNLQLTPLLKEANQLLDNIFSSSGIDSFLKNKKTLGIKLYDTPSSIMPDFYFTNEPTVQGREIKESAVEKLEIDLDSYKSEINSFLKSKELNVIIIIDRLDEFVSQSVMETQLKLLQALVSVEREYESLSNIEIKFFLRDDLFKQLSFDNIGGYDKVISKKVDLSWSAENIREFIAKRIFANYKHVFRLSAPLQVYVDTESLEIDTSMDNQGKDKLSLWGKFQKRLLKKFNPDEYKQKFPRKTNLDDNINKQLITTLFPDHVCFKSEDGKVETKSLFDFFANNFNLGTNNSIPRLILLFLEKLISVTTDYYMKNSDELPIKLTDENRYEIIREGFFEKAYEDFKKDIYINFSKLNPEFESKMLLFKDKIGNRYSFRAKEIKNFANFSDDNELFHFCNYMLHIGVFERTNSSTTIENMKFELPFIFRNIKNEMPTRGNKA
ncbi:P-loop ATPase, Sll1717 family [Labilibaculum euxinus]